MIGHVTIADLREAAKAAKGRLWQSAADYGREPKIYLHWTAGHYNQTSEGYHVNIKGNGDIWQTRELYSPTDGTWRRNSGAVNLTICGCFDATTNNNLGSEPPTHEQINEMAKAIAAIAEGLGIPIDKYHVMTHGEAAANEDGLTPHPAYACWHDECGDGQVRWDLEYLATPESPRYNPRATDGSRGGDVLRGKANWYRNEALKAGKIAPNGKEYEQNDIDYLVNLGYDMTAVINMLKASPKYAR